MNRAFRNFRRQRGLKIFIPRVVRYGYFVESPTCMKEIAKKNGNGQKPVATLSSPSLDPPLRQNVVLWHLIIFSLRFLFS